MVEKIYESLLQEKVRRYQEQRLILKNLNVAEIESQLKKGNYLMLSLVRCFKSNSHKNVQRMIKESLQKQQKALSLLLNNITEKIINSVKEQIRNQQQLQESTSADGQLQQILQQLISKNVRPVTPSLTQLQQLPYIPNFFNKTATLVNQEPRNEQEELDKKQKKRKMIKKEATASNFYQERSSRAKPEPKTVLKVLAEMTQEKWAQKLEDEKFKEIVQVQIFSEQYTTQDKIIEMLTAFPKIQRIAFNCRFKLHKQIPKVELLTKIGSLTLDFKWDLSKMIVRYFTSQYFPNRSIQERETIIYKSNPNLTTLILSMKNSKSLWIYQAKLLKELVEKMHNFSQLKTLNISCKFDCKSMIHLKQIKQLSTLVLKEIKFDLKTKANNSDFFQFMEQNHHISTFILGQSMVSSEILKTLLISLKSAFSLKNLSIQLLQQIAEDCQLIFSFCHLQTLHLKNIVFYNSNFKSWQPLNLTSNLSIHQKDLCKNLPKQLLKHLLQKNRKNLTTLYIGGTCQFTDQQLDMLVPLKTLTQLGLDQTKITGKKLRKILRDMQNDDMLFLGLAKAPKSEFPKLDLQDLKVFSQILTDLTWLNIEFQHNLWRYDFKDFKKLDVIVGDPQLAEKLKEEGLKTIKTVTRKPLKIS